ncbi:MAG: polyamine aminopropyltransferase [Desulfobacterales bacterium]|nr:polyamine aminopropyltransferase [Desulfobacterales bacterium]
MKIERDSIGYNKSFHLPLISPSFVIKACLFATGCSGIVAEYTLSTLASYLIGNAVFQWTIVMSLMLFAMGIGSRITRYFYHNLLDIFIVIEFILSISCALSSIIAYSFSSYPCLPIIIYIHSLIIGCLIGLEMPLVIRLNQEFEELRVNISGIMEKDYYGALLGGAIYAFIALPFLGLTYTPILLGAINAIVASIMLLKFFPLLKRKKIISTFFLFTSASLIILSIFSEPIILFGEQKKYKDKIIFSDRSKYQKIVITQWKDYYWLYVNGHVQFSTYDEEKYNEPLVHPAMKIALNIDNILILGGGDGLALREVLKHKYIKSVTLVDIDPFMTDLAKHHPVLLNINKGSINNIKVKIINEDALRFIKNDNKLYSVIIIDLPAPDSFDLMHLYSSNFYIILRQHLIKGGIMVTQATSPYFSQKAFLCILRTIRDSGYSTLPYHNHIPTMGEWGWIIGIKSNDMDEFSLKKRLLDTDFSDLDIKFLSNDSIISMAYFGKGIIDEEIIADIKNNTDINPVLYYYYLSGSWGSY